MSLPMRTSGDEHSCYIHFLDHHVFINFISNQKFSQILWNTEDPDPLQDMGEYSCSSR